MNTRIHAALALLMVAAPALGAQQPEPRPAPAPEARGERRMNDFLVPGAARVTGFAVGMFNPSHLLERREMLNLSAEQVTRLSALEQELKTAREKAGTDAKPHREQLESLLEQSAPDVGQVRSHAQALMQAEQALRLATITAALQAKATLTGEQRGRVQGWSDRGRPFGVRRSPPGAGPRREGVGPRPQGQRRMPRPPGVQQM